MGSTFFTLYTSLWYAFACFLFLNVSCGYTYTLFISIYWMLSPSCSVFPTFTVGTKVGESISASTCSAVSCCSSCPMAEAAVIIASIDK